jgi:hypothetical protein
VTFLVVDDTSGEPISGALVRLIQPDSDYDTTLTTTEDGRVVFTELPLAEGLYTVRASGLGYQPKLQDIMLSPQFDEVPVRLPRGVWLTTNPPRANMRSGPSIESTVVARILQGEALPVLAFSDNEEWVQAKSAEGIEGWFFAEVVTIHEDGSLLNSDETSDPGAPPPPVSGSTPVPGATSPPRSGAVTPPIGANLVQNPSFEQDGTFWVASPLGSSLRIHTEVQFPAFVLFPEKAAYAKGSGIFYQVISGLTPGSVYRLAAWSRTWSSTDTNRNHSTNPGIYETYVCINTFGGDDPGSAICSSRSQPIGRWVNHSVDVVAESSQMSILLVSSLLTGPENNEAMWDEVAFGISPIVGLPTPTPTATPIVISTSTPSSATGGPEFRDAISTLMDALTEMGGVLDRFGQGDVVTCNEYLNWYDQVSSAPRYHNVPSTGEGHAEWQQAYGLYVSAIDDLIRANEPLFAFCQSTDPNKILDPNDLGNARQAIDINYPLLDEARNLVIQLIELGYG